MKRLIFLALLFFLPAVSVFAEEGLSDYETLLMFYKEEELVVSPTRFLKSITKTAENITVITAKDIELMNFHTVNEILNSVTGVEVERRGNYRGSRPTIQGSSERHVLIVVDGVPLNSLADGTIILGTFPVQNIKRIEIIKGPASSAWGSSLGGVVNIITKETGVFEQPEGSVYGSFGEQKSLDGRLDMAGKNEKLSYYVYGGSTSSNGYQPKFSYATSNFYGKLQYDASHDLKLQLSSGYNRGRVDLGAFELGNNYQQIEMQEFFTSLKADYTIDENSGIDVSFYLKQKDSRFPTLSLATGAETSRYIAHEFARGADLKYSWQNETHSLVIGGDYSDGNSRTSTYISKKHDRQTWDVFVNDTITFDKLTLIPGIRYDSSSTSGDFISPSLGMTYSFDEQSLIRAYVARGFAAPPLNNVYSTNALIDANPSLKVEQVMSYQVGMETTALKYAWLKLSLFRHDTSDSIALETLAGGRFRFANQGNMRKQGIELEIKTVPFSNFVFDTGYNYIDARDLANNKSIEFVANHVVNVAVEYDDHDLWRGKLSGHYKWWDSTHAFRGRYNTFIWDFNLIREFYETETKIVEGFVNARNLLNDQQQLYSLFPIPGRNIEIGFRVQF